MVGVDFSVDGNACKSKTAYIWISPNPVRESRKLGIFVVVCTLQITTLFELKDSTSTSALKWCNDHVWSLFANGKKILGYMVGWNHGAMRTAGERLWHLILILQYHSYEDPKIYHSYVTRATSCLFWLQTYALGPAKLVLSDFENGVFRPILFSQSPCVGTIR